MGTKRKRCDDEQETGKINKKRKIAELEAEDRFSNLPESLQLHILASLDTKHALPTSMLSKTWVSIWTRIPALKFNSFNFETIRAFDKFVYDVLRHRDHSTNLQSLKFFHTSKICGTKILKKVFDYAFLSGVKELEVRIQGNRNNTWRAISPLASFDSLTILKLESQSNMSCPFLGGTMSISFKNLTVLHLKHAVITDNDRFSGFPVLESLTLIYCESKSKTLSIHALRLSELTISSLESIESCELMTPRLRLFDYRGPNFPLLQTHEGIVLEKVVIDFNGACSKRQEKLMFEDLMSMLCTLRNVKSLKLFSAVVELLSSFPDELVRRSSPFLKLKELKLGTHFARICLRGHVRAHLKHLRCLWMHVKSSCRCLVSI